MKNRYGACMHSKMTCCRRVIHLWMRIERRSRLVRAFYISQIDDADGQYIYRDQEDEATIGALSNTNGNESSRSGE